MNRAGLSRSFPTLLLAAALMLAIARVGSAAPPDLAKRAKDSFTEGTAYFNLGQWDKAIDSWQRGYQYRQDPIFLYNIGQAYRKSENYERAIFFYKNYLRNSPKAPNREEVEGWIAQLERLAEESRAAKLAQAKAAASEKGTERRERPPSN